MDFLAVAGSPPASSSTHLCRGRQPTMIYQPVTHKQPSCERLSPDASFCSGGGEEGDINCMRGQMRDLPSPAGYSSNYVLPSRHNHFRDCCSFNNWWSTTALMACRVSLHEFDHNLYSASLDLGKGSDATQKNTVPTSTTTNQPFHTGHCPTAHIPMLTLPLDPSL